MFLRGTRTQRIRKLNAESVVPKRKILGGTPRALAGFLQRNSDLYLGRTVLELGAGGGLPGLVTAKCGARKVRASLLAVRQKRFLFWPPLIVYCIRSAVGGPHGLPGQGAPR